MFDGKIGLWPVAECIAVRRSRGHRPTGTLEWKSLMLNKEVYSHFIFEKVFPAILQKMPRSNQPIYLQQDNVTPHISPQEFCHRWNEEKNNLVMQF